MGIPLREPIQTWCICHGLSPQLIPYTVHQVCRRFVWVTSEAVFLFRHKKNSSNKAGDSKIPSRFFSFAKDIFGFLFGNTQKSIQTREIPSKPDPIPGSFAEEKGFGLHSSKACAEGVGLGWLDVAYLGKMILNPWDLVPYFRQTYFQNWDDDTRT